MNFENYFKSIISRTIIFACVIAGNMKIVFYNIGISFIFPGWLKYLRKSFKLEKNPFHWFMSFNICTSINSQYLLEI